MWDPSLRMGPSFSTPLPSSLTGLCAVPVLTQTPSASSSLGGSAKLTCTLSSEHSTYYIEWHQQSVGQAPRYLMKLTSDGSVTKGDGIPDRFSGSSSGADRYLTIANIQSEDETEYICGGGWSSVEGWTGGRGQGWTGHQSSVLQ
uniref:Ig-like domain-containing protein n=1 Tax=Monodon monoceros TaxID=40151 RepID=A0A8C6AVE6_MONMO